MALNATEAITSSTGEIYFAADPTTLPSDAATAMSTVDTAFKGLGFLTPDGFRETHEASRTDHFAWQNNALIRNLTASEFKRYSFAMLQFNEDTLEAYYGVGAYTSGVITDAPGQRTRGVFVLDEYDNATMIKTRTLVYDAEVTDRTERQHNGTSLGELGITVTCYPDATTGLWTKSWVAAIT